MQTTPIDRRTLVFGPAYLDRVLRASGPLLDGATLDLSVGGTWADPSEAGSGVIRLVDPAGAALEVSTPSGWSGPSGEVRLSRAVLGPGLRRLVARESVDDLGGMGAGFAAALGGTLVSAVGPGGDPTTRAVLGAIGRQGVDHRPVFVEGRPADWTLLISSGQHGDKLAVGFRGCHAGWSDLGGWPTARCRVKVVAGLSNRLADRLFEPDRVDEATRGFFPSMAAVLDVDPPMGRLAGRFDLMSCNRGEWLALAEADRRAVDSSGAVVAVTDGPRGASIRFTDPEGRGDVVEVSAFPRARPPADTNRAGEAFGATLLAGLVGSGWRSGRIGRKKVEAAAQRASAAAALVLDRPRFGFPTEEQVDDALDLGRVG